MTPAEIAKLIERLPKEAASGYHIHVDGFILHPHKIQAVIKAICEHADITLKPKPDPCEVAFEKDMRNRIWSDSNARHNSLGIYRLGYNTAKGESDG